MEKYYGENVEPQHKMYWNFFLKGRQNAQYIVEPQHKMYWNFVDIIKNMSPLDVEPQHKMYWNNFIRIFEFTKIRWTAT